MLPSSSSFSASSSPLSPFPLSPFLSTPNEDFPQNGERLEECEFAWPAGDKLNTSFGQLFEQLRIRCPTKGTEENEELVQQMKDNYYFDALQSVLKDEKQKIENITREMGRTAAILISQSNMLDRAECTAATEESDEKSSTNALERTMAECIAFCSAEGNEEKGEMAERRANMRECLMENDALEQMIDQNANFCIQRANRVIQSHAQVRPIGAEDARQLESVFRLSAELWKDELKNAVCSQLLLMKAQAGKKRKRQNFSADTIQVLNKYFMTHIDQPYPDEATKSALAEQCGITLAQVSNWFGNKRIRFRKSQANVSSRKYEENQHQKVGKESDRDY